MASGEFDVATYWPGSAARLAQQGLPEAFVVPQEGAIGWLDALSIPATSSSPEAATAFIDWIIDPDFYVRWAEKGARASANSEAAAALPEDAFNRAVLGDPAVTELVQLQEPVTDEQREAYLALWQGLKAAQQRSARGCNGMTDTLSPHDRGRLVALLSSAYLWQLLAIFLPLSAMLFFSFLSDVPFGTADWGVTFDNYWAFFETGTYATLLWKSVQLGLMVTVICVLVGFPCALVLAKQIRGRSREALFLLVILPFWSNSLVRVFSWAIVLRGNGVLDVTVNAVLPLDVDAARSLGAGRLTILWRLLLPLSLPGLLAGTVLVFVPVVGSFMEPRILGGRVGTNFGTVIEDQFVAVFNWPLGAALSFILLAVVLAILAIAAPVLRRART